MKVMSRKLRLCAVLLLGLAAVLSSCAKKDSKTQSEVPAKSDDGENSAAKTDAFNGWFMAQTDEAVVQSISATSELVEAQFEGKYLYPPINILDGDLDTVWCEADPDGSGIGEAITIQLEKAVSFDEIRIVNGFASGDDYYGKNNRVREIELTQVAMSPELQNEHYQRKSYVLLDGKPEWQSINFELPQTAQILTIKILDIYKGSKYDDTCLGDIQLCWKGSVIPFRNVSGIKMEQEANSRAMLGSSGDEFKKKFMNLLGDDKTAYLVRADGVSGEAKKISWEDRLFIKSISFKELEDVSREGFTTGLAREIFGYNPQENDDDSDENEWKVSTAKSLLEAYGFREGYHKAFAVEYDTWERNRPVYELGNGQIIKTQVVDYIDTRTVILVRLEDGFIWLNGVKYKLYDKPVFYCFYSEF